MIDIHTYPIMVKELIDSDPNLWKVITKFFGFYFPPQPLSIFLMEMDEAGIQKVALLPLDCTVRYNCRIVSNEQVAELSDKNPRFIGFSSVDPRSKDAPRMLERAVVGLGLKGLKLNPALQGFFINDREHAFPVYQTCSELKIPLLIHCGMSWAPTAQARYAHPLMLEEVAQEFPNLRIIIAHFGWPWVSDAVMLAIKYPNIYLDTAILYSGTPADAYRKVLGEEVGLDVIERSLRDKILFGSNYPRVDIRRSVRGIQSLKINETLKKKIMSENALQILSKTEGENL